MVLSDSQPTLQTLDVAKHVVLFVCWPRAVGPDSREAWQVTGTVFSGGYDGIPEQESRR